MDLQKILKQKIINDILKINKGTEWSVLVYDRKAARIIQNLFTKSEFVIHNIVISQRIEEERDEADFPVIYFVDCTENIAKIINEDFKNKKYSSYTVCSMSETQDLNESIKRVIVNVNFVAIDDHVFISDLMDVYSVASTLETSFYVEYTSKNLEGECEKLDSKFVNTEKKGKLLVFERHIDLFSPLIHFFTFQALLEDLELTDMNKIYDEYGDTKLWKDIRYEHLGDLNTIFKGYTHDISANMKKLDSDIDTKDLLKMVLEAPETLKTKEMLEKFFGLAQKCYDKFEYMKLFSDVEQNIVTGYDKSNKKVLVDAETVFEHFRNGNIEHLDKLRLYYLYKFKGYEYQSNELEKLESYGFKEEELQTDTSKCNYLYFKPIEYKSRYEYAVSRFAPYISVILKEYISRNKKLVDIFRIERPSKPLKSLRKSHLLSVKKDISKDSIWCIYVKGGITYPEIASINRLTDLLGIEFVIGSDKIYTPKKFIEYLTK